VDGLIIQVIEKSSFFTFKNNSRKREEIDWTCERVSALCRWWWRRWWWDTRTQNLLNQAEQPERLRQARSVSRKQTGNAEERTENLFMVEKDKRECGMNFETFLTLLIRIKQETSSVSFVYSSFFLSLEKEADWSIQILYSKNLPIKSSFSRSSFHLNPSILANT
jgi:hypothetical protein